MGSSKSMFFALFALWFGNWCEAYQFYVGGRDGWVLKPSESYSDWPHRLRFQVNDTLLFKYKKGSDSVLVVNRDDFDKCNKVNPIVKMDGGDSVFKFDRSGAFYFISGQDDNCQNGQKLLIVVLAVRSPPSPTSTAPANSPESHSPANPPPESPAPVTEPPSPAPSAVTPTTSPPSPSPAPSSVTPTMAPSPGSPPEPFSPEANSPLPSPSSDESSPPAPAKSSSESVTPCVLVLLVTGLFGAAVIAH